MEVLEHAIEVASDPVPGVDPGQPAQLDRLGSLFHDLAVDSRGGSLARIDTAAGRSPPQVRGGPGELRSQDTPPGFDPGVGADALFLLRREARINRRTVARRVLRTAGMVGGSCWILGNQQAYGQLLIGSGRLDGMQDTQSHPRENADRIGAMLQFEPGMAASGNILGNDKHQTIMHGGLE